MFGQGGGSGAPRGASAVGGLSTLLGGGRGGAPAATTQRRDAYGSNNAAPAGEMSIPGLFAAKQASLAGGAWQPAAVAGSSSQDAPMKDQYGSGLEPHHQGPTLMDHSLELGRDMAPQGSWEAELMMRERHLQQQQQQVAYPGMHPGMHQQQMYAAAAQKPGAGPGAYFGHPGQPPQFSFPPVGGGALPSSVAPSVLYGTARPPIAPTQALAPVAQPRSSYGSTGGVLQLPGGAAPSAAGVSSLGQLASALRGSRSHLNEASAPSAAMASYHHPMACQPGAPSFGRHPLAQAPAGGMASGASSSSRYLGPNGAQIQATRPAGKLAAAAADAELLKRKLAEVSLAADEEQRQQQQQEQRAAAALYGRLPAPAGPGGGAPGATVQQARQRRRGSGLTLMQQQAQKSARAGSSVESDGTTLFLDCEENLEEESGGSLEQQAQQQQQQQLVMQQATTTAAASTGALQAAGGAGKNDLGASASAAAAASSCHHHNLRSRGVAVAAAAAAAAPPRAGSSSLLYGAHRARAAVVAPSVASSAATAMVVDGAAGAATIADIMRHPSAPFMIWSQPRLFVNHGSPEALTMANELLMASVMPDGISYMPLTAGCRLWRVASAYGFTSFSIALGSSYFQRLLQSIPQLQAAVRNNPRFADYAAHIVGGAGGGGKAGGAGKAGRAGGGASSGASSRQHASSSLYGGGHAHQQHSSSRGGGDAAAADTDNTLQSIQYTCVFLATKVTDRVATADLLRWILGQLYAAPVTRSQACDVEAKCLEGLKWRLGPFFAEGWPYCDEYDYGDARDVDELAVSMYR